MENLPPDRNIRRARIFVSGKVQGVFYRVSTKEEAQLKGLSGWVRNLPDGAVEAVFEGTPEAVEDMINWCHIGPRGARVLQKSSMKSPKVCTVLKLNIPLIN
ncbi:MAG: hypothetical protein Fur0025_23510 [Oscillatoriaceae cyanobacterium]